MQIKGSHLGFYIDFMVIFKTGGRNEFLTPKYPRIEVLLMIVAVTGNITLTHQRSLRSLFWFNL